jgi:hypothetical protein
LILAFQSIVRHLLTAQLVAEAKLSFAVAQARYRLELTSISELSQAQLQQTSTEIGNTNPRYQFRVAFADLNYEEGATPSLIVLLRFAHGNTKARNNLRRLRHFTIESLIPQEHVPLPH